ncbi:30S ribosome-binding factor RbfA [bacterium]|nr:30S ribosome-binding factor RbfA [bacterium]
MSLRNEKVRKALMREISDIIFREIKDPRLTGVVSITDVDVSSDNSAARVFFSVLGDEELKQATKEALDANTPRIRHEVGKRIRLRHTPSLLFIPDDSLERGMRINSLLNKISRGEL